ncbi:MAG: hypothetical protein NZ455_02860 [Bacteroidia bacterium]|nr:hypothetical protein [Bacteroidia bacterium]
MRRVRQQCGAQRSTAAIAQPAARRPERSEGTRPSIKTYPKILLLLQILQNKHIISIFVQCLRKFYHQ